MEPTLKRRIGLAHAQLADLPPTPLNLGMKFVLMLAEVIKGGTHLFLRELWKSRPNLFRASAVREFVEHNFNHFDRFASDPGDATSVQFDWRNLLR